MHPNTFLGDTTRGPQALRHVTEPQPISTSLKAERRLCLFCISPSKCYVIKAVPVGEQFKVLGEQGCNQVSLQACDSRF